MKPSARAASIPERHAAFFANAGLYNRSVGSVLLSASADQLALFREEGRQGVRSRDDAVTASAGNR